MRKNEASPLELVEPAVTRFERRNPTLNAVFYKKYDYTRQLARGKPLGEDHCRSFDYRLSSRGINQ